MAETTQILLRETPIEGLDKLDVYRRHGGYQALEKALKLEPKAVVEEVKKAGLRGRGGAGFPCGVKWGFIPSDIRPHYLCLNADESEPGTYKDRVLIETDPHQIIEGTIISSYAIEANTSYIYIRGEFGPQARILERALEEAREAGFLGKNIMGSGYDLDLWVHRGAGAYICGEETSFIGVPRRQDGLPTNQTTFSGGEGFVW